MLWSKKEVTEADYERREFEECRPNSKRTKMVGNLWVLYTLEMTLPIDKSRRKRDSIEVADNDSLVTDTTSGSRGNLCEEVCCALSTKEWLNWGKIPVHILSSQAGHWWQQLPGSGLCRGERKVWLPRQPTLPQQSFSALFAEEARISRWMILCIIFLFQKYLFVSKDYWHLFSY